MSHLPVVNPAQTQTQATSYVYFIQAGDSGAIKIGWAVDPAARLDLLQIGNHETLTLLATIEGGQDLERSIHRKLGAHRTRGEWFTDTPELRDTIRELETHQHPHLKRIDTAVGNGQNCRHCGALLTEADDTKMPAYEWWGHCRACREFAELRATGNDPFDE